MTETGKEMYFESLSNRGAYYKVDFDETSCSCKYFQITLKKYSIDDPRRLCKHLIQAFMEKGIPESLQPFKDEIKQRAIRGQSFLPSMSSMQSMSPPIPEGSIKTITAAKKRKYVHLTGLGDGNSIRASVDLETEEFNLEIYNDMASGSLRLMQCVLPKKYKYMENALLEWISREYRKLMNFGNTGT